MYKWLAGILLIGALVGCQAPPSVEVPTPVQLRVQVSPALDWLRPAMAKCTAEELNLAITVDSVPSSSQSLDSADVLLQWSTALPVQGTPVEMGMDELVIIVNPENLLADLDRAQLVGIFSGTVTNWEKINGASSIIQPWVYPFTDDAMVIFEAGLLSKEEIDQASLLAPSPESMRAAVSQDPQAIGILPARWLDTSVKKINLVDIPTESWTIPILAVTTGTPAGSTRNWLLCLQDAIQP